MKALLKLLLPVILLLAGSSELLAQRQKKESSKVTPASAQKKEAGAMEQKQADYRSRKDHHLESQDKATRKRMKKTLKKAERHSWGNRAPWYKRWFRRK
jgi:flagellar biosynthesis/type III secretory pathway M-ring protein FliF/YscJ